MISYTAINLRDKGSMCICVCVLLLENNLHLLQPVTSLTLNAFIY